MKYHSQNLIKRTCLWGRTLRYLSAKQIASRGLQLGRRALRRLLRRRAHTAGTLTLRSVTPLLIAQPTSCPLALFAEYSSEAAAATVDLSNGHFQFLNQGICFPEEPDWNSTDVSRLWRFNLHYFDYVQSLIISYISTGDHLAYDTFRHLCNSWIRANELLDGDGWHPYTISRRIVNWAHGLLAFEALLSNDHSFRQTLLRSLYGQARFLNRNLEFDVRGNHLIANLRALIWAGLLFEGREPQRWYNRALSLLRIEVEEQILPDGGHFERCPGYHVKVLSDCLEIAIWLERNSPSAPTWLNDAVARMCDYLLQLLPLSGDLPLLKDTSWDLLPDPFDLLTAAALYLDRPQYGHVARRGLLVSLFFDMGAIERLNSWPSHRQTVNSTCFDFSGHYVLRDDERGEHIVIDAGKPCPDYLPAHAHADLLTYELTIDYTRIIVDSGVYEYTSGMWRDYFRSTRAHNTVAVCEQNQSEVWDSFRVARRATPGPVVWRRHGDVQVVQASHDGYCRLHPRVVHRRTFIWWMRHCWIVFDELHGSGSAPAMSHIHFHPTVLLEQFGDSKWRGTSGRTQFFVSAFGHVAYETSRGQLSPIRQGWYSERFGTIAPNTVLALHSDSSLPSWLGYAIGPTSDL